MTDCDDFAIVGVEVDVKSGPHCSKDDAESDCLNQILAKCEEKRKALDLPMCSSGKGCVGKKKCVEYLLLPSPSEIITVPSRDRNCKKAELHYVSSYKGPAQSACHCEELVAAGE